MENLQTKTKTLKNKKKKKNESPPFFFFGRYWNLFLFGWNQTFWSNILDFFFFPLGKKSNFWNENSFGNSSEALALWITWSIYSATQEHEFGMRNCHKEKKKKERWFCFRMLISMQALVVNLFHFYFFFDQNLSWIYMSFEILKCIWSCDFGHKTIPVTLILYSGIRRWWKEPDKNTKH